MARSVAVRRLPTAVAALALAIASATSADAQQVPPIAPPGRPTAPTPPREVPREALTPEQEGRPFQFRTFLHPEVEYNDNFFLSETNEEDDLRETLTGGLSFRFTRGPNFADFAYLPSVIHSSVQEGELEVFHLLNASGSLGLSNRVTLNAADRFVRSDVPALIDPRGIRRDRQILIQNTVTSDLVYQGNVWSLVPRYAFTFNRNEEDGRAQVDPERSTVHEFGADVTRQILRRNAIGVGYARTLADFKIADDFTGQTARLNFSRELSPRMTADLGGVATRRDIENASDVDIYGADIGFRRDVWPLYTLAVRFGYNVTEVEDGVGDEEGFTFLVQGTHTRKNFRITTTNERSIQETFLERTNVGTTETTDSTWELAWDPARRLTFTLRARVAENRFLQTAGEREDFLLGGGLEVAFKLTRLLSLTVGYEYTNVDSNLRGFDYENNVIRFGLTVTYP